MPGELAGERQIGGDHRRDFGNHRSSAVRHQQDRLPPIWGPGPSRSVWRSDGCRRSARATAAGRRADIPAIRFVLTVNRPFEKQLSGLGGKSLIVRSRQEVQPRSSLGQPERPPRAGGHRRPRRHAHRQHVPRDQSAAAERAHAAHEAGGSTAQHRRDVDAATNRQRRSRAGQAPSERHAFATSHVERLVHRRRPSSHEHLEGGAADRADSVSVGVELRSTA